MTPVSFARECEKWFKYASLMFNAREFRALLVSNSVFITVSSNTVLIQLSSLHGTQKFKMRADHLKFWIIENIQIMAETSMNKQG